MKTIRFRLYDCGRYFIEVWDSPEKQWEDVAELPKGHLLVVVEDTDREAIGRFRDRSLEARAVTDPADVVIWERK